MLILGADICFALILVWNGIDGKKRCQTLNNNNTIKTAYFKLMFFSPPNFLEQIVV